LSIRLKDHRKVVKLHISTISPAKGIIERSSQSHVCDLHLHQLFLHRTSHTTHQTLTLNQKQIQNVKQTQYKPKKKKKTQRLLWAQLDPSSGLEESGDEEGPEGGEKERGRESRSEIHVFQPDLSLYSGHRSGRAWVSARSVKPTHVHRHTFDRFGRKPSRDPAARPVPADRPDAIDVHLQSLAEERKKNEENFGRERWVFSEKNAEEERNSRKRKERWVLKRKKQEKKRKKNVIDGLRKKPSLN